MNHDISIFALESTRNQSRLVFQLRERHNETLMNSECRDGPFRPDEESALSRYVSQHPPPRNCCLPAPFAQVPRSRAGEADHVSDAVVVLDAPGTSGTIEFRGEDASPT